MTGERAAKEPICFPSRPRTTPTTQQKKDLGIDLPRSFFFRRSQAGQLARIFHAYPQLPTNVPYCAGCE